MNRRTLLSGLAWIACGCGTSGPPRHGREANADRLARKIPVIPEDWAVTGQLKTQVDWVNPDSQDPRNANRPRHSGKTVFMDPDGTPASEWDYYDSGKEYPGCGSVPETPFYQRMTIVYRYDSSRAGKDPWECDVHCGPEKGKYTLAEAEAILREWGLQRIDARIKKEPK